MTNPSQRRFPGPRRLTVLAGLAALVLAGAVPAVAAAANKPVRPAVAGTARCSVSYLSARVHLASVIVDTAALNKTGTFTPPAPQPPLTGLPTFCDVTLTQTDTAGNPIHIEAWLPEPWTGRFQGVGGAVYACGPFYNETATAFRPATRRRPRTVGSRRPTC